MNKNHKVLITALMGLTLVQTAKSELNTTSNMTPGSLIKTMYDNPMTTVAAATVLGFGLYKTQKLSSNTINALASTAARSFGNNALVAKTTQAIASTTYVGRIKHSLFNSYIKNYPTIRNADNIPIIGSTMHRFSRPNGWMLKFLSNRITSNPASTVTEQHFANNLRPVLDNFNSYGFKKDANVRQAFVDAHKKQIEEQAKGNTVVFHGRTWDWDLLTDMYKQLYNAMHPDAKIGDDYVILRLGNTTGRYANRNGDPLFVSKALFEYGKNKNHAADYLNEGIRIIESSTHEQNYSLKKVFAELNLNDLFEKYTNELMVLEQYHMAANKQQYGTILAISIDEKNTNWLSKYKPTIGSWLMTKLRTQPIEDTIESDQVLYLDPSYALDPQKGPRIFQYHAANPKAYEQYKLYRDALIAKMFNQDTPETQLYQTPSYMD